MDKRIFSAIKINLNPDLIEKIANLKKLLVEENIKWVDIKSIHLTLNFFGETQEKKVNEIIEISKHTAKTIRPFNITLSELGVFKNFRNPTVLWIGIEKNFELNQLFGNLWNNLRNIGYSPDYKQFSPHITIARIKYLKNVEKFKNLITDNTIKYFHNEEISEFTLYESVLKSSVPQYFELEKFSFAN